MEFDPNDIKNLIMNLNREQFYGSIELTVINGKVTYYKKIETVKPTQQSASVGASIKIIDNST